MLSFQAERCAASVGLAAFAGSRSIQEIPRIELDSGFRRPDLHDAPGRGLMDYSRECQISVLDPT